MMDWLFSQNRIGRWLLIVAMLWVGLAMAQTEPTMQQIYQVAQTGKLDQAQIMVQQVLVSHPNSAKAHFVRAELFARQGNAAIARDALATAEKLAPGLPFAKPESVQTLRAQISSKAAATMMNTPSVQDVSRTTPTSPFPWGWALLFGGGVVGLVVYLTGKKSNPSYSVQPASAIQGDPSGAQTFGPGGGAMQPSYAQAPGASLGGKIMGGVATGLAVGAGVMAAEAIGKSLTGNNDQLTRQAGNVVGNDFQPFDANKDMGGQDFGINDSSSWDSGGAVDAGGGDWDT